MTAIVRFRGDTHAITRTMRSKRSGGIIDITGYSFKLTVNGVESPIDEVSQKFQIIGVITDADLGQYQFVPSTADATVTGNMFFDIEVVDAGGAVETVEKDTYKVNQDITKT